LCDHTSHQTMEYLATSACRHLQAGHKSRSSKGTSGGDRRQQHITNRLDGCARSTGGSPGVCSRSTQRATSCEALPRLPGHTRRTIRQRSTSPHQLADTSRLPALDSPPKALPAETEQHDTPEVPGTASTCLPGFLLRLPVRDLSGMFPACFVLRSIQRQWSTWPHRLADTFWSTATSRPSNGQANGDGTTQHISGIATTAAAGFFGFARVCPRGAHSTNGM